MNHRHSATRERAFTSLPMAGRAWRLKQLSTFPACCSPPDKRPATTQGHESVSSSFHSIYPFSFTYSSVSLAVTSSHRSTTCSLKNSSYALLKPPLPLHQPSSSHHVKIIWTPAEQEGRSVDPSHCRRYRWIRRGLHMSS